MIYQGHIALDRELTFNQARQVLEYCKEHGDQLTISSDGRSIVAVTDNSTGERPKLEDTLHGLLKSVLIPLKLRPTGVITVRDIHETYQIVVIKNMVKLYKDSQISDVGPAKT